MTQNQSNDTRGNPRLLPDDILEGILTDFFHNEMPESLRLLSQSKETIATERGRNAVSASTDGRTFHPPMPHTLAPSKTARAAPVIVLRRTLADTSTTVSSKSSRSFLIPGIVAACLALGVAALLQTPRHAPLNHIGEADSVASNGAPASPRSSFLTSPGVLSETTKPSSHQSPAPSESPHDDVDGLARSTSRPSATAGAINSSPMIGEWHEDDELLMASRPADAGDTFVPFAILEHVEPVERSEFQTKDGPVELQSKRNILRVQFDDEETGSFVQMTIPELDIQVLPLEVGKDRK